MLNTYPVKQIGSQKNNADIYNNRVELATKTLENTPTTTQNKGRLVVGNMDVFFDEDTH